MAIRPRKRSSQGIIGSFPYLKNRQPVAFESTIERDFSYFFEYDRTVRHYTMKPMIIEEADSAGVLHCYHPDVLVEHTNERVLVECTFANRDDDRKTQHQYTLGQKWADANGCDFMIITASDLRTGYRLANLKLMWRYARLVVPHSFIERCIQLLTPTNGMVFHALVTALNTVIEPLMIAPCLYSLLFQQVLLTNLDRPITAESHIRYVGTMV